jgi:hypothetical protein
MKPREKPSEISRSGSPEARGFRSPNLRNLTGLQEPRNIIDELFPVEIQALLLFACLILV